MKVISFFKAYQFDTLPKSLKKEEMQPGDLIFYSASYFDPNVNLTIL